MRHRDGKATMVYRTSSGGQLFIGCQDAAREDLLRQAGITHAFPCIARDLYSRQSAALCPEYVCHAFTVQYSAVHTVLYIRLLYAVVGCQGFAMSMLRPN